jgi:hypothetical protein
MPAIPPDELDEDEPLVGPAPVAGFGDKEPLEDPAPVDPPPWLCPPSMPAIPPEEEDPVGGSLATGGLDGDPSDDGVDPELPLEEASGRLPADDPAPVPPSKLPRSDANPPEALLPPGGNRLSSKAPKPPSPRPLPPFNPLKRPVIDPSLGTAAVAGGSLLPLSFPAPAPAPALDDAGGDEEDPLDPGISIPGIDPELGALGGPEPDAAPGGLVEVEPVWPLGGLDADPAPFPVGGADEESGQILVVNETEATA